MTVDQAKALNKERLAPLHPLLKKRGSDFCDALAGAGVDVLITQGFRSWTDQAKLYAQGRNVPGKIVTNAKPGWSWHQFGLAFDAAPLVVVNNRVIAVDWSVQHPDWQQMLLYGARFYLSEGASWRSFPDDPHFYPEGLPATPPDDVRQLYLGGDLPAVWKWAEERFKG